RVRIGPDRDRARHVSFGREFALQKLRSLRLGKQFRFEIEAGGQTQIGMGRAGEAVDAAMLAAAIWIDRAVKRDIGRIVVGDDPASAVDGDGRLERRQLFRALPAVIERNPCQRLETARRVRVRTTAATARAVHGDFGIRRSFEINCRGARLQDARLLARLLPYPRGGAGRLQSAATCRERSHSETLYGPWNKTRT